MPAMKRSRMPGSTDSCLHCDSPQCRVQAEKKSKEEILEAVVHVIHYARSKFDIVEFSPEGATRTGWISFSGGTNSSVDAGATYINIPKIQSAPPEEV